jgi:hypothetical protein
METLTTVVSRISMKVASITDIVTTHGLTCLNPLSKAMSYRSEKSSGCYATDDGAIEESVQ